MGQSIGRRAFYNLPRFQPGRRCILSRSRKLNPGRCSPEGAFHPGRSLRPSLLEHDLPGRSIDFQTGRQFARARRPQAELHHAIARHGAVQLEAEPREFAGFVGHDSTAKRFGGGLPVGQPAADVEEFAHEFVGGNLKSG